MKNTTNTLRALSASDLFGLWECSCGNVNHAPALQLAEMDVICDCGIISKWSKVRKLMKIKPKPNDQVDARR